MNKDFNGRMTCESSESVASVNTQKNYENQDEQSRTLAPTYKNPAKIWVGGVGVFSKHASRVPRVGFCCFGNIGVAVLGISVKAASAAHGLRP